jgi:hypothetical protein
MKNWLNELFSEKGSVSMTRFLSLVCVFTAVILSVYGLAKDKNIDSLVGIVSVFLGAGLSSKVIQKFAENKVEIENEK